MPRPHRSGCPINLALEVFGDRWSLIILRDMMFGNRRHFRDLLTQSEEGISSSILADRLKSLLRDGLLSNRDDPSHKQRTVYSLTESAIQLVPAFAQLGAWGRRHTPVSPELSIRAELLEAGGPGLWERYMDELRAVHLNGAPPGSPGSVMQQLQAAYLAAVAAPPAHGSDA
jgi:DNA-binding HxlR family transcriptional regulator